MKIVKMMNPTLIMDLTMMMVAMMTTVLWMMTMMMDPPKSP